MKRKHIILLAILTVAFSCFFIEYSLANKSVSTSVPVDYSGDHKTNIKSSNDIISDYKQRDTSIKTSNKESIEKNVKHDDKKQSSTEKKDAKKSQKIVYLTIDDGPCSGITDSMLDILKEQQVKATFFVIGRNIAGNEKLIKRMYNEGHSIGLHSYTHNIKNIYSSNDIFIEEMVKTACEVEKLTGNKPQIIRFPGGSSKRLNKDSLNRLHEKGYKIYDWTISAGDGTYPKNPPEKVLENALEPKYLTSNAILLMHSKPNNQTSVKALPLIIKHYKDLGYEFKILTKETPEYYFKF